MSREAGRGADGDPGPVSFGDAVAVDYDADAFLLLPTEEEEDVASWSETVAAALCREEGLVADSEFEHGLARALAGIATAKLEQPFDYRFVYMPALRQGPLPVLLAIGYSDSAVEETVRYLTGADDPRAVEPPVVEEVSLPAGDTAMRTIKYLPGPPLTIAVNYAWWSGAGERFGWVRVASHEIGEVLAALEDLDEFVRGIEIGPVPSEVED